MRKIFPALLLSVSLSAPAIAGADVPHEFLIGEYELVGKNKTTQQAFTGSVKIEASENKNSVTITRNIDGKTTTATGKIVKQGPDKLAFLEVTSKDKSGFKAVYEVYVDNNNYARIMGSSGMNNSAEPENIEALFPKE